jgi:aminopeptidase N
MNRLLRFAALVVVLVPGVALHAQAPRKIAFRAVNYEVNASLSPANQTLSARARVEFEVVEASRVVAVELHPNLKVTAVFGPDGKPLTFDREDSAPLIVHVQLPQPETLGRRISLTFEYAGPLANEENSPVKGVRLAYIGQDSAYLLLPARWFPLTDYPANRYTGTFNIEAPQDFAVVGTGRSLAPSVVPARVQALTPGKPQPAPSGPRVLYSFRVERPVAAGTFVAGNIQLFPVRAEGLSISVFARGADASSAAAYGEALARVVNFFSAGFGPLPEPNLALAQLPEGAVPMYAAPGLLLLNQRQWSAKPSERMLAHLAAHEWWGNEVLPASASDVWLTDGLSRYSEALYAGQATGKEGANRALEDFAVGALTYEDAAPISQAARLELFSSEYRSVVVNKGAMIFHMLRAQLGDAPFEALLRDFYTRFAGKAARLDDFERMAQAKAQAKTTAGSAAAAPPNLTPFFAQWLNSTGVPEFKIEYVVYRVQKGFRIVGRIKQDLETFRMPVEVRVDTEGNPELRTIDVIGTDSAFTIETFGRPKPNGIVVDPNNSLLKGSPKLRVRAAIARGEELAEQGRYFEAIQQYQRALEVQKNNSLADFRIGEAFFYQKNYQAAANAFREATEGDLDPSYKWVEVWAHMYLGKIFDISGQRERAINEYDNAKKTNDDTGGAQAEADKYLKQPYKEDNTPGGS